MALRKWMKEAGVWQLDLCKLLEGLSVETISDFQSLSKDEVKDLINETKKTGFMHSKKLKALHPAFANANKKKKKKQVAKPKKQNGAKQKDAETLKREAREPLEEYMRQNGIWQIDLFNLLTDEYEIYSVEEFESIKAEFDEDEIDEFLLQAQQRGVMKKQANILAELCGRKKKKKKKQKKVNEKPKESKPRQKGLSCPILCILAQQTLCLFADHSELKIEARPKLEKYMRENDVWQIDLFDLMTDQYEIYSVDDFLDYKDDEDWIDEFLEEARRCGVMVAQVKRLEKLCGRRKAVKKKKKKKMEKNASAPKKKELSPEVIQNMARDQMEPFMQEQGFWHKDLFLILLKYDVYKPDDLKNLSKSDRKEIIQEAKQKGLMGKVKKFKAYFN